ncbi:MAG: hypothetical protein LBC85_03600 [Fibromonadaceae bacterium]|jgi:immune inhibitor A|nr:hypothetical protein [Fibromonadaceae bacterium]
MKKLPRIVIALFSIVLLQHAHTVPAYPHPADYTLPDGSTITIQLFGDEFVSWRETLDGYTLLFGKDGFLEYAIKDESGDLKASGIRASNKQKRTKAEKKFLDGLPKKLWFSSSQAEAMRNRFQKIFNHRSSS